MTPRRPLADLVIDVASGAIEAAAATPIVSVTGVEVSLPVEVVLRRVGSAWELVADLPRTVTRTAFDIEPGRLAIVWTRGGEA